MARGRHDYEKQVIAVEIEGLKPAHGRTLLFDDFEDVPLKWAGAGTCGGTALRTAAAAYNGSFGLEMATQRAAPGVPCFYQATRAGPLGVEERIELEAYWKVDDLTLTETIRFGATFHDGILAHYSGVQYVPATTWWQAWIGPAPGAWANVVQQTLRSDAWHELSLRCDYGTDLYTVMVSDNIEANISTLPIQTGGLPVGSELVPALTLEPNSTTTIHAYYDDILIREVAH